MILRLALLLAFFLTILGTSSANADRLLLRSSKLINNRTVESFDPDGIQLDDGTTITWDEIERGTIEASKQEEFNRQLKEFGEPLFRIRTRLKNNDYEGLLEFAEAVYPTYVSRKSQTAYMVFQALMWARLAAGKREAAVEPFLRAYTYLRSIRGMGELPGERRLRFDAKSALSLTLPPVWFNAEAAKQAVPGVLEALRGMEHPRPEGVFIYYATLASAAGDADTAAQFLDKKWIPGNRPLTAQWRDIALAQTEILAGKRGPAVDRLKVSGDGLVPQTKPAAIYWLGMSDTASEDPRTKVEGVLRLVRLPAVYGTSYPELAGAGLYYSSITLNELNDPKGSVALRKELLIHFAHTVHAEKARSNSDARAGK